MAASTCEAIPLKLPIPPSTPSLRTKAAHPNHAKSPAEAGSTAERALATASDGDVPSSLDVHVRWMVESGAIVHKGGNVAQLFYARHGAPPPPLLGFASASASKGIIRARTKQKRWVVPGPSAGNPNGNPPSQGHGAASTADGYVPLTIQAPADGFLKILYAKPLVLNAVRVSRTTPIYSAMNLILAAIEPCEHPAVVGGLCVVCGVDTRALQESGVRAGDRSTNNQNRRAPAAKVERRASQSQHRQILPERPLDPQRRQIIERQRRLAASMAASDEFGGDDDDELARFDVDAAVAAHATGSRPSTATQSEKPSHAKGPLQGDPTASRAAPTSARSLSSLLSGAKATQQMQQIPAQRNPPRPRPRHAAAPSWRSRQTAMSPSTVANPPSNANEANMSKVTVSGGVTITISESEAKSISDASSKKLKEEKKLCLVLDLDHTLLHATDDCRAGRFVAEEIFVKDDSGNDGEGKIEDDGESRKGRTPSTKPNHEKRADVRSILLPVELPPAQQQQYVQQKLQQQKLDEVEFRLPPLPQQNKHANSSIIMRHFVKLRPHLKEFFGKIQSTYQLSVYTAGTRAYAEQVAVMICRHLVGASMDEEELNGLRAKVREKDEECRKFKARMGRKKQLEIAKQRERDKNGDVRNEKGKDSGTSAPKRKSVTFGGNAVDGGKAMIKNGEKSRNSCFTSKDPPNSLSKGVANNPSKVDNFATANTSNVADGVCESVSSSSTQKRQPSASGVTQIPRKKKCMSSGSLLGLLPAKETEPRNKDTETEEGSLFDPSEARDQLRKQLEEAEKLEIKAVELRRKMFGSRIVSRTDVGDLGKDVKSLKRVFPCGGVMAAILDDREDVWANADNNATGRPGEPPENLLLVKPYHWKPFKGYADVNNSSGNDLSKSDDGPNLIHPTINDEEDDMQLLWTADILHRLHERYYSTNSEEDGPSSLRKNPATVPSLLQAMRKETFLRFPPVKLVFSGLIPINMQKQAEIRPPVVRYAEELGATVLPEISREVTHLVAARDRSEKTKQARTEVPGCYIVHTSWLMECFWSISRRDVRPHHMGPMPSSSQYVKQCANAISKKANAPSNQHKKDNIIEILDSDEEDSDEDSSEDDFAADLERSFAC